MANNAIQIAGVMLCLAGALCTLLAVVLPEWRRNDPKGEVLEAVVRHQGIWIRCVSYSTGLWQCDDYDAFFLGLPQKLQVARGLSIVSLITLVFALLLSVIGMECTTCMTGSKKAKCRVALVAAGFWIVSALSIGSAVSYYSHWLVQDYEFAEAALQFTDVGTRYVFGSSLFLGWGAMAVGTLGGAIMMCGSCYVESEEDEYWNRGPVGRGVRRMRSSFRQSYRAFRPRSQRRSPDNNKEMEYV